MPSSYIYTYCSKEYAHDMHLIEMNILAAPIYKGGIMTSLPAEVVYLQSVI